MFDWVTYKKFFLSPEITCPNYICLSSSGIATLDVDSKATNITWALTPAYLFTGSISGTGKTAIINTSSNNGSGKITYTFYMPGGESFTAAKIFWVGTPPPTQIAGFEYNGKEFASDFIYQFGVNSLGVTDYQWSVGGGTIISGQGTDQITVRTAEVTGQIPVYFDVAVRVKSIYCGTWSSYFIRNGLIVPGGGAITIAPNPTSGEITLTIETISEEITFNETAPWDLEVYSETQMLKTRQTGLRGQSVKIQTAGWKEGVYLVRVNCNGEVLIGKLAVKR